MLRLSVRKHQQILPGVTIRFLIIGTNIHHHGLIGCGGHGILVRNRRIIQAGYHLGGNRIFRGEDGSRQRCVDREHSLCSQQHIVYIPAIRFSRIVCSQTKTDKHLFTVILAQICDGLDKCFAIAGKCFAPGQWIIIASFHRCIVAILGYVGAYVLPGCAAIRRNFHNSAIIIGFCIVPMPEAQCCICLQGVWTGKGKILV
jgi:hypothetical protein